MSKGNHKKAKTSRFKNAVTGKTYTKMADSSNVKALKAEAAYAVVNPKKTFYV